MGLEPRRLNVFAEAEPREAAVEFICPALSVVISADVEVTSEKVAVLDDVSGPEREALPDTTKLLNTPFDMVML